MNDSTQLDTFETALLTELRREVSEHPAPAASPAPSRRPRRRLRLAAIGAAAVAASTVAVFGLGSSGGSPAYAVEKNSSGDVIVTVHLLDDADGLEKALRAKGIDADVSYDANGFGTTIGMGPDGKALPDDELPPTGAVGPGPGGPGPGGHVETHGEAGPGQSGAGPQDARPGGEDDPCGLGGDPATLTQQGSDWVLTIPADSPLQDRHVEIGTDSSGALSVAYAGDEPNSMCGMVTVTRGAPRTG
jgi:hypothetical protein